MYKFVRQDNQEAFFIPFDWCDVSVKKYIGFYDIIKDIEAEDYRDAIFNDLELFHAILTYWVGFDSTKLTYQDKIAIFSKLAFLFADVKYVEVKGFSHNNVVYHLPESKNDYFGKEMPLAKATFSEIVECLELEKNMNFINALPYILAILCKPHGEKYNDQKVSERATEFETLPMNLLWSICFFLTSSKSLFRQTIKHYLKAQAKRVDLISMAGIMH